MATKSSEYYGWHEWTRIVRGGPTKGMVDYFKMINCPVDSIGNIPGDVSKHTIELEYNDLESLRNIMQREGEDVACVIMEPFYFDLPREGYLEEVKALAGE